MLEPQSSLWGFLDGKTKIEEVRTMDIRCPECGFETYDKDEFYPDKP